MTTGHCDQKGCTYSATAKNQGGVNRLIGLHKRKAHGIAGKFTPSNKPKRAYTKRASLESEVGGVVMPNLCPMCGCNIRAVAAALNIRRKS